MKQETTATSTANPNRTRSVDVIIFFFLVAETKHVCHAAMVALSFDK